MEVRRTQSGNNACSWGIAWNSRRKNGQTGEYEDVPHYFDVECWASDGQLKFLQDVRRGARCAIVDGHLEYQSWQKDGQTRSKVVIRVDDPIGGLMVSQGGGNGGGNANQGNYPNSQQSAPQGGSQGGYGQGAELPPMFEDDIPFGG